MESVLEFFKLGAVKLGPIIFDDRPRKTEVANDVSDNEVDYFLCGYCS